MILSRFLIFTALVIWSAQAKPETDKRGVLSELLEEVHFLIPAGPGGGWDGTARGIGNALRQSGLVTKVSYQNLSGGGGGRATQRSPTPPVSRPCKTG